MKATTKAEGVKNWAGLQKFMLNAEAADPVLAKRNARFSAALKKRQKRETKRILSRPGSKAYRDYMATPV